MSYGEIIKKIRRDFNMTLIEFAKKVDVSKSHIHRLENEFSTKGKDKLSPPLDLLHQICEKTGYPFRQFLEEAGYIKPVEVQKSEIETIYGELSDVGKGKLLMLANNMLIAEKQVDMVKNVK